MTTVSNEITEEERILINKLKERMKDVVNKEMAEDDHMFKRFIRARNHDIDASERMLRKHLIWRKENNVDTILQDYIPHEGTPYVGFNLFGLDKEGSVSIYVSAGNLDFKGILKCVRKPDVNQFIIHFLEKAISIQQENNKKTGKYVDNFTFIFNFENFSIFSATHKPTLELCSDLISIYEPNYPERLKVCFIINASLSFTLLYSVIKPFLTGNTSQKIAVYGKDGWKEKLSNMIDGDVLPAFLGGKLTDPNGNPMCKTFISHAGKVPERFYINRKSLAVCLLNAKRVVVPRKTKAEIKLEVMFPGSTIEYEFETKTRDIGFSLIYKGTRNSEPKELVPKQRMETGSSPESRMFRCENAGIYILEFDNSYSWWHQKEIFYRASITLPHNSSRRFSNCVYLHK